MINREIAKFLVVGTSTVAFDYICYICLIGLELTSVSPAKAISFLVGTLYAYFANRFWTFENKVRTVGSAWRFSLLYASTLVANILINALALKILVNVATATQLAFLLATGVSACLNFIGMKFFVFRSIQTSEFQ